MKSSAKSLPHSGPVCFEAGGERPNYAPPGLLSEMRKNLRIAEERYRRTFEKAPIGIAETDIDGCILDANEQYCAIVGRARGELLGLHFSQVVHPEQLESTMADFEELIARRQTAVRHHRRYVRPDGKTGWGIVTLSALQDDAGNVDSVIVLVEDVTDRELAAGNLREHEEQLAEAQQIANMGSWEVDLATGRRTWSAQMCRMYGCPPGVTPDLELIRTLLHPDDLERVLAVERKARETLQPFSMAFRIVLLDGRTHITHVHGRFVFDLDGKPTKLVGVVQDITERVTHEDELRRVAVQQAAVANLGQLALSGASLDFLFHQVSAVVTNLLDVTDCEIVPKSSATPAAGGIIVEIPSSSDEAWGVLSIRCAIEQGSRTTDLDFLRSIAGILGQAIERQRADDELRLRAMQQSAIADLGKLMLSTVDDATLDRACDLVVQGLGVDYSCFAEITPDNTAMFHRGGRTWSDDLPQKMPVVEETHVGLTLLRGEPVIVDDYATETRFRTSALAVRSGIVSGLAVPVASATRSYGVLSAHTKTKRSFSPGDVDYLRSLANILADALEREAARAALVASVAEARREGSERQQVTRSLQLILESTIEGIYTMDVQGRCTMINAAAARMLGRSREEMLGQDMHELMHAQGSGGVPFEEVDCPIYRVLRDRAPRTVINDVFWRSDGSPLPIDYSAAPIFDGQTAVGAVVAFTDTTERRKLELKLEQANRLSSLGRLAATVAHEFNNVLMGIAPFVELIRRRPERAAAWLDQIGVAIARGKRITEEILRFSKPADPIQTVIAVEPWLQTIRVEAQSLLPASYAVVVEAPDPGLYLVADRNQLSQVLMNLILNARDAMADGGVVTIVARRDPSGTTYPFGFVEQPERFTHFVVRDTGSGMPPETLKHIFEPLFTTKKHGTGLGLAVAHQVVQRHGGEIFAESGPDGSTFHVFIPSSERSLDDTGPAQPDQPPRAMATPGASVLLVDDDPTVAAGLAALLELEGFSVEVAVTGADALAHLAIGRPDLVLLDVRLPDMNGTEVYERIAVLHPGLPVVFSTGHATGDHLDQMLQREGVEALFKPYDATTLLETIGRLLPK